MADLFSEAKPSDTTRHSEPNPENRRKAWPVFDIPTQRELHQIGELRCLGHEGLFLAVERGLLWCATYRGARCYVITDASRRVAQARRLDGRQFILGNERTKAVTLGGSLASFPVGLPRVSEFPVVLLVEGGPDLLAAHHFISVEQREADCCAVAMLGASQSIAESTLPVFSGRRVRLFPHLDENIAGRAAAGRWTSQLNEHAQRVDGFDFGGLRQMDGSPVRDLNDLTSIDPDDFEEFRLVWNLCPNHDHAQHP